jgi:hypothetical protein
MLIILVVKTALAGFHCCYLSSLLQVTSVLTGLSEGIFGKWSIESRQPGTDETAREKAPKLRPWK